MTFTSTPRLIALATICMTTLSAQLPDGWFLAGNRPADYLSGIELEVLHEGLPVLSIKSRQDRPLLGFGAIMKELGAEDYLGQRVRLTAFVKSEGLEPHGLETGWAGLWLRVDDKNHRTGPGPKMRAFDNTQMRPSQGAKRLAALFCSPRCASRRNRYCARNSVTWPRRRLDERGQAGDHEQESEGYRQKPVAGYHADIDE